MFRSFGVWKHAVNMVNVYCNLKVHSAGYPTPDKLRACSCCGIRAYGKREGKGFAQKKYMNNAGVSNIIYAVDKEDERPVHIALWGGTDTLAQALWTVEVTRSSSGFYKATWPGISADLFTHGSEDGYTKGGFTGADTNLISNEWLAKNVQNHGAYGAVYPASVFIMEGEQRILS